MPKELEAFGVTYNSIRELADTFEINASALAAQLRRGKKAEEAIEALLPIIVHGKKFRTHVSVANYFRVNAAILRHRVKKMGMSYEKALSIPVKKLQFGPVIVEGVEYSSFSAACKAYGREPERTRHRLHAGMTPEEAILAPNKRNKPTLYLNTKFESHNELASYFGLNRTTFYGRVRAGWSIEDAVNKPVLQNHILEYRGVRYPSLQKLCESLGVEYKLIYKRWHIFKWPLALAIETPKKQSGKSINILGKKFGSLKSAANFYCVEPSLFRWRLSTGWALEKAIDPNPEVENNKAIEIDGEFFENMSMAARAFQLNPTTFMKRIREGWSNRQAAGLDEPPERNIGTPPVAPDEYLKRLSEIHGDNLSFDKANFAKAQDKVEVVCNTGYQHSTFWATPNNLLRGKGCPICKLSHGARKVAQWLDDNDIIYDVEWTGHGLRSIDHKAATLRMDFHLPTYKTIIEFDGIQHFEPTTFGRMTEEQAILSFHKLKENDRRKNDWAEKNGYRMLRIAYDQSVSDKLSSILV